MSNPRTSLGSERKAYVEIGDVWTKITVWVRSDRVKAQLERRKTRKPNRKKASAKKLEA
jgi:hypothetical protein